jgi:CRP/FNR family transcriptional regulator
MKDTVPVSCNLCGKQAISAYRELSEEDLSKLTAQKTCAFFKKGQMLMHEGSRAAGVYCIHDGKVKLYRMGTEGREQIIRFAQGGDLIGYRSVLSGETLSASIEALTDTHACFVPKSTFFEFLGESPKFSLEMMRMTAHELGEASKLITNLAQKSVRERLAEVLMIMRDTFGETEEGNIDVTLTREEIASMVGTVTETAIRILSEFKDAGYVELRGRKIRIVEPRELLRIAQVFD